MKKLKKIAVENTSGYRPNLMGLVDPIREGYYKLEEIAISGNAPKDFIRVYEYGKGRKENPSAWPAYIAKVGHKWYPNESITEQLMTRIGQTIGIKVAESNLMLAKGQLRFLSKYFLNIKDEQLVHGSEIITAYIKDEEFVQKVDEANQTKELFTFESILDAIKEVYQDNEKKIISGFIEMLFFDALVGNNDRHFENWGVIENVKKISDAQFSPVYDTARGLFWNYHESNLDKFLKSEKKFKNYIKGSKPTTGWNNKRELNHFELIELVIYNYPEYCNFILTFDFKSAYSELEQVIEEEFGEFFSEKRRSLITKCLKIRTEYLHKIIK